MSTVKDLKAKVINTLSILSGQDITETKLYKSILTINEEDKKGLIGSTVIFAMAFADLGKSLKTTEIYKWLEIILYRFKVEEGIDMKDYMCNDMVNSIFKNLPRKERRKMAANMKKVKKTDFLVSDYPRAWSTYFGTDDSNYEKIAKIIQPLELFIITAITVIPLACQINQKPFEHYANMDIKVIWSMLMVDYAGISTNIYLEFPELNIKPDTLHMQYIVLDLLVNRKNDSINSEKSREYALNGQQMDEMFEKLINVSQKSEYEKFKEMAYKE